MFRRLESSLPADYIFPTDLQGLGYFINDEDQIRMISDPAEPFHYFISKNERYVEMQKEAMSECIRQLILERVRPLSLEVSRLPRAAGPDEPHISILTSRNLDSCSHCLVYLGESCQDLGVLAGRIITLESVAAGSIENLVRGTARRWPPRRPLHSESSSPPPPPPPPPPSPLAGASEATMATTHAKEQGNAPIDASDAMDIDMGMDMGMAFSNPGQLVWNRRLRRAISYASWHALPRPSAVHPGPQITRANYARGNHDAAAHLASFLDGVVAPLAARGCRIDLLAAGTTAMELVDLLQADWARWAGAFEAIVVTSVYPFEVEFRDEKFKEFWGKRARAYVISTEPAGTPVPGRSKTGCNVYSGGEPTFVECIVARAFEVMLDYFKLVQRCSGGGYENEPQVFEEGNDDSGGCGGEPDCSTPWEFDDDEEGRNDGEDGKGGKDEEGEEKTEQGEGEGDANGVAKAVEDEEENEDGSE